MEIKYMKYVQHHMSIRDCKLRSSEIPLHAYYNGENSKQLTTSHAGQFLMQQEFLFIFDKFKGILALEDSLVSSSS